MGFKNCEMHPSGWLLTQKAPERDLSTRYTQHSSYFLAMLSILSFFFMRGREEVVETEASTREEVDCDT